jgi:hypothetical protein
MDPDAPLAPDANLQMMQAMMQQQQQQFFHAMQQQQQALLAAMQQQQQQPAHAAAQMLALSSLGQLKSFEGRTEASGLAAREWLAHAEHFFAAREHALGVTAQQGDTFRVHAARTALTDDALRWLSALPGQPATWADFRTAFLSRFSSVPAAQVREVQLQRFVDAARRIRDKLNVDGLQRYTTMFLQHAGEIPAERMTDATKRGLYAQGLPPRYAEYVLTEDAKAHPLALHEVAQNVLSRATLKAHAISGIGHIHGAGSSSASQHGDAMVDAISLCATQFGISREEAARYVEPGEGWAPHDTSARPPVAARSPAQSPTDGFEERMLAAFQRFHASTSSSSSGTQGKSQSQRRNVPKGLREEIPEALLDARKAAGLCIKCGVVKYEPGGGSAHNSRTCKAAADKTTSVADGKKKAGF